MGGGTWELKCRHDKRPVLTKTPGLGMRLWITYAFVFICLFIICSAVQKAMSPQSSEWHHWDFEGILPCSMEAELFFENYYYII